MEDGYWLSIEDKKTMEDLKSELINLKVEHKNFAKNKKGLTSEEKETWRKNSQRTNEVYIQIKDLRFKNVLEAGKSGKDA